MLASSAHIFHVTYVFGALSEFEREVIRERTQAGLDAARARGRKGGRKSALTQSQVRTAQKMLRDPETTVTEVAEALGVSRSTIYRQVGTVRPVREPAKGFDTLDILS